MIIYNININNNYIIYIMIFSDIINILLLLSLWTHFNHFRPNSMILIQKYLFLGFGPGPAPGPGP